MNIDENYKLSTFGNIYDQESQKKQSFEMISWDLFAKCLPVPGENPLIVEGYVLADGQGDYAHMSSIKSALHKKFPDRKIVSYIIGATTHEGKLFAKNKAWCEDHIAYSNDSSTGSPAITSSPFKENFSDTLDKIKQADLWVSGPISTSKLYDSLSAEAKEKKITINEYDAKVNMISSPVKLELLMGLGKFSKGIFIKPLTKDYTFSSLDSAFLKEVLFNSSKPSNDTIDKYQSTHTLSFGYMQGFINRYLYVKSTIAFAQSHHPGKQIDIILPKGIDLNLLKGLSGKDLPEIGNLKYISFANGQVIQTEIKINDSGSEIRIIDPGRVSPKDFKRLISLSNDLVGCTGNTSVSQVLSAKKIPFYEGSLGHTMAFRDNLAKLAGEYLGKESNLATFLSEPIGSNKGNDSLKHSEIMQEAKKFGEFLHQYYNFVPVIQGLANEILCRNKYPEFAQKQDEIKQNYLQCKISLEEVQDQLKSELQYLNLF